MRWEELFAALEDDARGLERGARDADFADRTRSANAQVPWLARVHDASVSIRVHGAGLVRGRIVRATPSWVLLRDRESAVDTVVAVQAVMAVTGLSSGVDAASGIDQRLGWTHAWRVLSRDRSEVRTTCVDASVVRGVPEVVGRDYVQIQSYDGGRPVATPPVAVPYAAVATVTSPR